MMVDEMVGSIKILALQGLNPCKKIVEEDNLVQGSVSWPKGLYTFGSRV